MSRKHVGYVLVYLPISLQRKPSLGYSAVYTHARRVMQVCTLHAGERNVQCRPISGLTSYRIRTIEPNPVIPRSASSQLQHCITHIRQRQNTFGFCKLDSALLSSTNPWAHKSTQGCQLRDWIMVPFPILQFLLMSRASQGHAVGVCTLYHPCILRSTETQVLLELP